MIHSLNPKNAIADSILAAVLILAAMSVAWAQTLTDPNPRSSPLHPAASKSTAAKRMKACPEYGAGFFRVEGTDACVKIGGFIDAGVSSR